MNYLREKYDNAKNFLGLIEYRQLYNNAEFREYIVRIWK